MSSQTGKRYKCGECGAEFVVTKGGEGAIKCCGRSLEIK